MFLAEQDVEAREQYSGGSVTAESRDRWQSPQGQHGVPAASQSYEGGVTNNLLIFHVSS